MSTIAFHRAWDARRPTWRPRVNLDSPQAVGLRLWVPVRPGQVQRDVVTGETFYPAGDVSKVRVAHAAVIGGAALYQNGATPLAYHEAASVFGLRPNSPGSDVSGLTVAALIPPHSVGTAVGGAWIKIGATNGFAIGIGGATLGDNGNQVTALYEGRRWISSGISIDRSRLNLIALTVPGPNGGYANAGAKIYLNGVLIYSDTSQSPEAPTGTSAIMGYSEGGSLRRPAGAGCEFRAWSRALSDADHWSLWDPSTMFDLYWRPSRRSQVLLSSVDVTPVSAAESDRIAMSETAAVVSLALTPVAIEVEIDSVWTDITNDVIGPMRIRYGCWDVGPTARVVSTGTCEFGLRNSARNSGGVAGYYSPGGANCMSGFTRGIRFRVRLSVAGSSTWTKFTGRLQSIRPLGGVNREQITDVVAVDWIDELAVFDARELEPQVDKTADELLTLLFAAMPSDAQPVATDLSAGVETFPYVWTNLGGGRNGLSLAADVVRSDFGYLSVKGDGTVCFFNRNDEETLTDVVDLTDDTLRDISVLSSLGQAFNVVRLTTHPKRVPASTIVLWEKSESDVPSVGAGESIEIWIYYRDPDNEDFLIAGQPSQFVDPPAATTDYLANSAADGSGTNLTASVTVTADFFATSAKLTIANGSASTAYMTKLQVRGKGIYDLDPVTYESATSQSYGRRPIDIDLPYSQDGNAAQDIANYLRAQFEDIDRYVTEVEVRPHYSESFLADILSIEPGDGISVTETMTGVSDLALRVNGVELVLVPPDLTVESARFAVAPRFVSGAGILDDAVRGVLDSTTVLGSL